MERIAERGPVLEAEPATVRHNHQEMLWYMLDRVSHGQAIAPEWLDELARLGLIQVRREGDDAIVAITPTGERWLDAVDRA